MSETVFEASFELALERARAVATKMPVETLFLAWCQLSSSSLFLDEA